jgi:prevent-host-death family protein
MVPSGHVMAILDWACPAQSACVQAPAASPGVSASSPPPPWDASPASFDPDPPGATLPLQPPAAEQITKARGTRTVDAYGAGRRCIMGPLCATGGPTSKDVAAECDRPTSWREMVIGAIVMTMSRAARWSVAKAKARFSAMMERAADHPQTIERRGKPLAVVVSVDQFAASDGATRWQRFLEASAEIRRAGGAELSVPKRTSRRSPFSR